MGRLTASLENRLLTTEPGELIDVIIEVRDAGRPADLPADKPERYATLERDFQSSTAAVTDIVSTMGGKVLGQTWLGGALKVRIPVDRVKSLLALDDVVLLDLPSKISR